MAESRDFNKEFEQALKFLEYDESDHLNILETITLNYLQSNPSLLQSVYVAFQVHLFEIFTDNANVILHYLKSDKSINYQGQYKRAFRRVEKLRKISYYHLNEVESSLAMTNKIKGSLFSYHNIHPWEFKMTLLRQDRKTLSVDMDINDAMNLVAQIIENTRQKLKQGNNEIDTRLFDNLTTNFNHFENEMLKVLDDISEGKNDSFD